MQKTITVRGSANVKVKPDYVNILVNIETRDKVYEAAMSEASSRLETLKAARESVKVGHTAMVQAYCDKVVDGVQQFTIEWQIHYMPWQFYISGGTRDQLVAMLEEFDRHGIEPVETMARWKWRKMKGNT